jgi:hypothetical protein
MKRRKTKAQRKKSNAAYPFGAVTDAGYIQTLLKVPEWSSN